MIPFSDEELVEPVKLVIDKVRPSLALDGGDIDFVTVKSRGTVSGRAKEPDGIKSASSGVSR